MVTTYQNLIVLYKYDSGIDAYTVQGKIIPQSSTYTILMN